MRIKLFALLVFLAWLYVGRELVKLYPDESKFTFEEDLAFWSKEHQDYRGKWTCIWTFSLLALTMVLIFVSPLFAACTFLVVLVVAGALGVGDPKRCICVCDD